MNLTILSRFAKQMISHVHSQRSVFVYPFLVFTLAVAYLGAGLFGFQFAILHENVTLVWGRRQ